MSKRRDQDARRRRLLPNDIPKYVRVYDNGGGHNSFCPKCCRFSDVSGKRRCPFAECGRRLVRAGEGSFDRYTVVFTGRYRGRGGRSHYVGMSCHPFHPQGFGQHGEAELSFDAPDGWPPKIGSKARWGNGDSRRIPFSLLPEDCQKMVLRDYVDIWDIDTEKQLRLL